MGLDDLVVNDGVCSSPRQSVLTKMTVRTIETMIASVCTSTVCFVGFIPCSSKQLSDIGRGLLLTRGKT